MKYVKTRAACAVALLILLASLPAFAPIASAQTEKNTIIFEYDNPAPTSPPETAKPSPIPTSVVPSHSSPPTPAVTLEPGATPSVPAQGTTEPSSTPVEPSPAESPPQTSPALPTAAPTSPPVVNPSTAPPVVIETAPGPVAPPAALPNPSVEANPGSVPAVINGRDVLLIRRDDNIVFVFDETGVPLGFIDTHGESLETIDLLESFTPFAEAPDILAHVVTPRKVNPKTGDEPDGDSASAMIAAQLLTGALSAVAFGIGTVYKRK